MMLRFRCLACKGEYFDSQLDGAVYEHVCPPLPAKKNAPARLRDDHRDENIATDREGARTGIVKEGAGVVCLTDKAVKEPRWISALKKRIEEQESKRNPAAE